MIHINLLPVRQIKNRIQARKRVLGLGITFLAVLALLGVVALFLGFKVDELQASITALTKEKAKYQTTINQIEKLKKDQALLETKLNTISQLKKGSQLSVRVMDELASLTPSSRLWLNSMSFKNYSGRVGLMTGLLFLKRSGYSFDGDIIEESWPKGNDFESVREWFGKVSIKAGIE